MGLKMDENNLPAGILKVMETLAETTRPYQEAVDVIHNNTELMVALEDTG